MESLSELLDRTKPTVVVVHSPRAAPVECTKPRPGGRVLPKSSDGRDPRNYLLSGGARALDKDREKAQAQAAREKVKELKTASTALASELLRTRQESEREITSLRDDMLELATRFKAEQERIALLKQRLGEEGKVRGELEEAHQERVRGMHKRLQAEHLLRVNAETELAKAQDTSATAAAQIKGVEGELAGALAEVAALQDGKLEAEMALNRERRQHAETQGQLESLKLVHERERSLRETAQRKAAELEGTVKGLSERNGTLFDDLKTCEAALQAAREAKQHAEGAAAHHREEIRVLHEQLESQRKAKAAALEDSRRLQQRVAELEAGTAVYIAKEAHYDDLKEEFDAASAQLEKTQAELERAKGEAQALADRLDAANFKAAGLEGALRQREAEARGLREDLERAQGQHREEVAALRQEAEANEESLAEAQAAAKLLMAAAKEKEAALAKCEGSLAEMQGSLEALRRGRDDLVRIMQDKDGYTEALQQELRAAQEELGAAQRRAKAMQAEADAGELELSRRDLRIKELSDMVHALTQKLGEEQASAATEKRRMEGVMRSLETRLSQSQAELAASKEDLGALRQSKVSTHAELAAAQEECVHLRSQLTEEQGRSGKLRSELAAVSSSHMKEVESKGQVVAEVTARLQAEEAARVEAQHETRALKRRVEEVEMALTEAQAAQVRTQEAYDNSQAALESMKRKLAVYKTENKKIMSSYDDWLKTMVKTRPGAATQG